MSWLLFLAQEFVDAGSGFRNVVSGVQHPSSENLL
jgi:hypothetical protein